MDAPTYAESELVMNRAPVLLSGGAVPDRAAWAQEAAETSGRPLVTVTRAEQLGSALAVRAAVLFVPDVLALGDMGQQLLVRTLTSIDERPKLILGLGRSDTSARQAGLLREDLHYRVRMGVLNLDAPGLRDAIAARRVQAARRAAAPPPRSPTPPRIAAPSNVLGRGSPSRPATEVRPAAKALPVAKARPPTKGRPSQRSRAAPRVKSARTSKSSKARPAKKGSKRR
ncbi:MAG: hypothetical protein ACXWK4_08575 [Myxococcaceae bacterium]